MASIADPTAIEDPPPVVIATEGNYRTVERRLRESYSRRLHSLDGTGDRTAVVFTREGCAGGRPGGKTDDCASAAAGTPEPPHFRPTVAQ